MKIALLNCWFGRRRAANVVCSMRPAKLPAAFCCRSVAVVEELTNALVSVPLATSGTASPGAPDGHPVPSALHPFFTFACMAWKEGRIGAELIWLASAWLYSRWPRFATYPVWNTNPPGSSRWMVMFHWCTVACLKLGSMTTAFGATPSNCDGGERKLEGCTVGVLKELGK